MREFKSIYAAVAAAICVTSLAGCNHKQEADPRTEPGLVRVAVVGSSQGETRAFTGVVTARVQSNLGFRVPGKITMRLVDTGQFVHAGQLLMTIDPTDLNFAVTARTQTVAAAKAKAVQAASDEARYRGLVKTGAISASTYDQVKATSEAAQADLQAAEAQAQVAKDEGDYSKLFADSDGTVVDTLGEPGQVVAAGQTVVKLAHAGPREAAVDLPETVRPALGSIADATIFGGTGHVPARLRQLSDAADPQTRTFEARYVLSGADAKAPLGSTVTIRLDFPERSDRIEPNHRNTIEVPVAALVDRGSGSGVWVLHQPASTVSFQHVQVQQLGEETAVLSSGVEPGDAVVALGAHLLHEGQQVRVQEEKAAIQ